MWGTGHRIGPKFRREITRSARVWRARRETPHRSHAAWVIRDRSSPVSTRETFAGRVGRRSPLLTQAMKLSSGYRVAAVRRKAGRCVAAPPIRAATAFTRIRTVSCPFGGRGHLPGRHPALALAHSHSPRAGCLCAPGRGHFALVGLHSGGTPTRTWRAGAVAITLRETARRPGGHWHRRALPR